MAKALNAPTSEFEKKDRCADLDHRPRVLLSKMGLDGHDRGVKVIARALRDSGVHVIYSGLWQTPQSVALSARDEDCDVVCASMMSNSHLVLGPKLVETLRAFGRPDIPVYMGGILPAEDLPTLKQMGIARCFTTGIGLEEIVDAVRGATVAYTPMIAGADGVSGVSGGDGGQAGDMTIAQLARDLSLVHDGREVRSDAPRRRPARVIGVTGSPGAGKSTLVAQLVSEQARRASAGAGEDNNGAKSAVVAFDPKSPITSGALLGDRLRVDFNRLGDAVFYRSFAISGEDYHGLDTIIELIGGAGYDTLFVETVGAGQNETKIRDYVDTTVVVLTPGMGDSVQMEKAGILEIADVFVCNKADHPGENELVRDLREIAGRRPIFETVATRSQGVAELLDGLVP